MEATVIHSFLPDLVTAVSTTIQSVSDQCLAKGLIPGNVYDQVLESGGTSKEKARALILAVKKSTETDSRCLEILLNILDQELPFAIRENLLSKIRKELTEKASTCRAVVPLSKAVQQVPLGELSKEIPLQQSALLGRFEDSIRQHEHACAEKKLLEERLKVKSEHCKTFKGELETLKGQNKELASNTQIKIAACTKQIENLEKGIEQLQKTIEEQGMQARRGRNTIITKTEKMFVQLAQQSQQEIQRREEELKAALREAEAFQQAFKKVEEEMKMKDREHKLVVQERDLKIKELEVESKQKESSGVIPSDILKNQHLDKLYQTIECSDPKKTCRSHWRDVGSQLGFSTQELDDIYCENKKRSGDKNNVCTKEMLRRWLQWYPNDSRGSVTFPTYSSLKKAMIDAGCGYVVSNLLAYGYIEPHAKKY